MEITFTTHARMINLNLPIAILILLILLFLILLHLVFMSPTVVTIVTRLKEMQLIHTLGTLNPHGINERFTFR